MTIRREIKLSLMFAGIASAFVAISIFIVFHRSSVSKDLTQWGQFGDYFGGLLNPLFAFLAFYWLTRSIILQKEELEETRRALRDSATALEAQVKYSERGARITALSAILTSVDSELSVTQSNVHHLRSELHRSAGARLDQSTEGFLHLMQRGASLENVKETLKGLELHLEGLLAQRNNVIEQIKKVADEAIT